MEYGNEMELGLLAVHMHTQNSKEASGRRHWETTDPSGETRIYRMAFLTSGTDGNEDGNAGSFISPACTGYRHNFGGGKPPPPTVPPMRHPGILVYT